MASERRAVTVYDIAERAGVSQATVSRVLSGGAPVAAATRERVLQAMRELDYRPNVVAQDLARGRSRAVGILTVSMTSPYLGRLAETLEAELRGQGYRCMVASVGEDTEGALEFLRRSRIEGLAMLGCPAPPGPLQALAEEIPVAGIGPLIPGLEECFPRADNEGGGYRAGQHLLSLGHRAIAYVGGPSDHPDAVDRWTGLARALRERGVELDPRAVVWGPFHEAHGEAAVETLRERGVTCTAIFAGSDQIAIGVMAGLRRAGLVVPRDVSVIGFDDQQLSRLVLPPLTTIAQPGVEMAAYLARLLVTRMEAAAAGQPPPPLPAPRFDTPLVVRESTAPPCG